MLGAPGYTRAADSTLTPIWTISYGYEKLRAEKGAYPPPTEGKSECSGSALGAGARKGRVPACSATHHLCYFILALETALTLSARYGASWKH